MNKEELSQYVEIWKESNRRFMIIVCDTFDYEDYPVFCDEEKCLEKVENPGEMQKIMEVYDNQLDIDSQINEYRAYHLPK
jgi:hypothetical protein